MLFNKLYILFGWSGNLSLFVLVGMWIKRDLLFFVEIDIRVIPIKYYLVVD